MHILQILHYELMTALWNGSLVPESWMVVFIAMDHGDKTVTLDHTHTDN